MTRYNLRGEAVAVTNANGETAKSDYDALGRLSKTLDPLGGETRFQYDANGNLTCLIDANAAAGLQPANADGCTESRQYDEMNRLKQSQDAQGYLTQYTYDLLGNRTSLTDAENHTTTFKYDDLGRLIETVDPLVETPDKTAKYQYDEAGNLTQETDRKGQITRHSYDALNRKVRSDHLTDGSFETYSYDGYGDLTQAQNGAVAYTYAYTAKHQLQSKTDSRLNKTLSYTYDPAGNPKTKTGYPGDTTTYQYDGTGRLVAEANPAYLQASYHYDGAGRPIDRILSNGAHTRYTWDAGGRLAGLKNTTVTGQVVNDTAHTRDRVGNVLTQSETTGTGQTAGTTHYSYDPGYRLKTADRPGTASDEAYSYDKVGNRTAATLGSLAPDANTRYYAYDAGNRLSNIRTGSFAGSIESAFTYDANGSLLTESGPRAKTVTWNAQNRPSAITANGFTDSFLYDPSGYRIQKADSLGARLYLLEGEHLEAIYSGSGIVQAQYLRGSVIDEIVNGYQLDGGKLVNYTFHHDSLQSVLGQSGHSGSILSTQGYGAFGNVLSSSGNSPNKLKYTGREEDSDTGVIYYRARYLDPAVGRFPSEDPKGFEAGVNFYAYCSNNPVNCSDPSGLDPYTSKYTTRDAAAIAASKDILNQPKAAILEYGGWVYKNTSKPVSYSYTNFQTGTTTQNGQAVEIPKELLPAWAQNIKVSLPGTIHSHPYGLEPSFSADDIATANYNANIYNSKGLGVYTEYLVSLEAGNLQKLNINTSSRGINNVTSIWNIPSNLMPAKSGVSSLNYNLSSTLFGGGWFGASGGFVIYPNKSNTNMMNSVYSK